MGKSRRSACAVFLLVFAALVLRPGAQTLDFLTIHVSPEANLPLFDSADLFTMGGGGSIGLDLDFLPLVVPRVEVGFDLLPTFAADPFSVSTVGAGLFLSLYPASRFGISLGGVGGLYQVSYGSEDPVANAYARARAELSFRISPSFTLSATGSFTRLYSGAEPLYDGVGFGLSGAIALSGLRGGSNVSVDGVSFDPIFPIFYSHYDKNRIGVVRLENKESGPIRDVRVSLFIKQFMDQPKLCATIPSMRKGASLEVPVYALLTDQVLKLTESAKTAVEIIVEYSFLDSPREARVNETIRVNHRNALTWDDDRKAAAFVSAKDPAVLRYSKYAAGLIRESGQSEINQNLRFAMGLFEGLRLYGLYYVVDPTTPYAELSQNKNALDFLQFPNQTLLYKGGDCDDLSILFCSILESVGIETAFITIPGHIYMAFSLDMSEDDARATFLNPADLMFVDGKAWLPVEITMVNDSFLKAWQVGAKEWYDNEKIGKALMIVIQDAWDQFEPVGIPGEDTRIVLPPPDQIVNAYSSALGKFINRELQPRVDALKTEIQLSANNPKLVNRLGVLYAKYGLLDQAKAEFEKAGRAGYASALTNLGNIAYLEKKYPEAISYFQKALAQKGENKSALIGLARAQYEVENYSAADKAYAQVKQSDPQLADRYGYLVSRTDGAARASSASARTGRADWSDE